MAEPIVEVPAHGQADLLPVRMCNEFVYCPRLFHLEHVQGLFIESADTIEGRAQHDRSRKPVRSKKTRKQKQDAVAEDSIDNETKENPEEDDLGVAFGFSGAEIRSAILRSESWGVSGKIDMIELGEKEVVVVEYKRGSAPKGMEHSWGEHALHYGAWPADVAQVGLYMALLREQGLPCHQGRLYYRSNKVSRELEWSEALESFLREVVLQAKQVAMLTTPPDPLRDSPKCVGCSLLGACLPDEHFALQAQQEANDDALPETRRIVPGRDDRSVVYVVSPGSYIRKNGESVVVETRQGESTKVLSKDISHVAIFGPSQMSNVCLNHLLQRGITTSHHTTSGRILGLSLPLQTRNIRLRQAQFAAAADPTRCLEIARALVVAKIRNQRTVQRRYQRGLKFESKGGESGELPDWAGGTPEEEQREQEDAQRACKDAIEKMSIALRGAQECESLDQLRGYEGQSAACYFAALPHILAEDWRQDWTGRNRRPPRDRVNALLSFAYAMLTREGMAAAACVGLDPMLGFLHTMIAGRPALALDLMEPFRPAWVDTAVLRLLATHGIRREDFHVSSLGVTMKDPAKRALIQAYERRADELTTHPRFGYRMSYRRLLELEARVLGKWLVGEIDHFTPLWTR